ncbi:hypothetical protein ACIRF8_30990 [Streptomyces sp. NPDC102406]|uniref:hypothetical protein n=1 Tax=Streptomyces sp. NPDC102406 TaxID=3366171 RepID=UPI00382774FC
MPDPYDVPAAPCADDRDLALLRAADPFPADGPRYADGPLHHHAERALNRLVHGARARRALVLRAEAAVCALAALLVLALTYMAAPPATAAPTPPDSGPVPTAER